MNPSNKRKYYKTCKSLWYLWALQPVQSNVLQTKVNQKESEMCKIKSEKWNGIKLWHFQAAFLPVPNNVVGNHVQRN